MKVAILAYNGFATFELGCGVELFSLPRPDIENWYRGEVVTFDDGPLRATGGMLVHVKRVKSLHTYDMLIVPSWPIDTPTPDNIKKAVLKFIERGGRIFSFCSGAFLLGELGILDGYQATTHWRYGEVFQERFPHVHYVDKVLYFHHGHMGCSAGSASAIDLGMEIIRQDYGHEIANHVARRLVMSPHRSGGQSQFAETMVHKRPNAFSKALDWAIEHLNDDISVDRLAEKANMSRRSFDRHFRNTLDMSPLEWISRQKTQLAQRLLESSSNTIEQVAFDAGFNNPLSMRNHFQKYLSISPSQYRLQFGKINQRSNV